MPIYGKVFYSNQAAGSLRSARVVVPSILDLTGATSVVDVGCGVGTWLRVCADLGVQDFVGVDGAWVDQRRLRIAPDRFQCVDLARPPRPYRRFDLALSLEVAEHVAPEACDRFVTYLAGLSDMVVFSAAIPGQGGTGHVNEQWPDFWRTKFEAHGFVGFDPFRRRYWEDPNVEWWYAQNMFLYARGAAAERFADLPRTGTELSRPEREIHPGLVASRSASIERPTLGYLVRKIPTALVRTLESRLVSMRWE